MATASHGQLMATDQSDDALPTGWADSLLSQPPEGIVKLLQSRKENPLVDYKAIDQFLQGKKKVAEFFKDVAAISNSGWLIDNRYLIVGILDVTQEHDNAKAFNSDFVSIIEQTVREEKKKNQELKAWEVQDKFDQHARRVEESAHEHMILGEVSISYCEYLNRSPYHVFGVYSIKPIVRPLYSREHQLIQVRRQVGSDVKTMPAHYDQLTRLFAERFRFEHERFGLGDDLVDRDEYARKMLEVIKSVEVKRFLANLLLDGDSEIRRDAIHALYEVDAEAALPLLVGHFFYDRDYEVRKIAWQHVDKYIQHKLAEFITISTSESSVISARKILYLLEATLKIEANQTENDPLWCGFLFANYLRWRVHFRLDIDATLHDLRRSSNSPLFRKWSAKALEIFEKKRGVEEIDSSIDEILREDEI